MSNSFGQLLNYFRKEKNRATEDMVRDLLIKHHGFTRDDIKIDELNLPDKHIIRVSLISGVDVLDWQTATLEPSFQVTIIREANLPDYHPDHPDNFGKSLEQLKAEESKQVEAAKEESGW